MDGSSRVRRRLPVLGGLSGALVVAALALSAVGAQAATTQLPVGISRLVAVNANARGVVRGIATFSAKPTAADAAGLKALGLTVQRMKHVPLALVEGAVASMSLAVRSGKALDIYPNDPIKLYDTKSTDAMNVAALRARGLTGKGVTVAVVDSGCDASHPDLADHVVHNVKLYSPEYVNGRPEGNNTIVVPTEMLPYNNSDLGGGHGTHVAGIIAADSTTDPVKKSRLGVAPDASLVCYSIGEVLFTTAVVTAYDHMLDQPDLWGIDVVNNSWGNSYRQFDPRDPVAVITRAVTDLGVTVVFASGNSGDEAVEMGLNPFSQAPWVISVAAGSTDHHRASFSSNGLAQDNSLPSTIGAGGHTTFYGDRIGVYHPDVTAPGLDISSTCDTVGTVIGPCPPPNYDNASASGTSMASPHVAGAAAILKQANPALAPWQVRVALQAAATPVKAANGSALPFWQVGYGYVDLAGSVALVQGADWRTKLNRAQAAADARVRAADGFSVTRSDFWTYDAPAVTANGTDSRTYRVDVARSITNLKVAISHPSLAVLGINGTSYDVVVKDAAGRQLGKTTESLTAGAGTATAMIDLRKAGSAVRYGTFTIEVTGVYAVSDPDTLDSDSPSGRMVTLQVAQLVRDH